jgi:secondary thiamine-phosphate synthase enzyme
VKLVKTIDLKSNKRIEFIDITEKINIIIRQSGIVEGACFIIVPHTTAALTINENSDPDVVRDILNKTSRLIPPDEGYSHSEGNSDSHLKSSLFGPSLSLIINENRLLLGIWQAVYFCEFDGPRNKQVYIKLIPG